MSVVSLGFQHIRLLAGSLTLGLLLAGATAAPAGAACRMTDVTGQWQHLGDDSHWAFFSNNRADCRVCLGWDGGCRYVPDPTDKIGRKQCEIQKPGDPAAPHVRVTGWEAEDGELARLLFSDGSRLEVREACDIDRSEGTMTIRGIGTLECHYNYQCNKIRGTE